MRNRPLCAALIVTMSIVTGHAQTGVFTRSYDIARTGANTHETQIRPANVAGLKIRRVIKLDSGDDPRIEAQPLYVPHVTLSPGHQADLLIVATMKNNVYAFDVNTGAKVWKQRLGTSIKPAFVKVTDFGLRQTEIDLYGTNLRWGILSTPVIDPDTNTLYESSWVSLTGKIADAAYKLFALNVATGAQTKPPIVVDGSSGSAHFQPNAQKQRSALLLVKVPQSGQTPRKTIFVASGLVKENEPGHGWVIAFDVDTFKRTAAWASTPSTQGGGMWQANQGPAADDDGFIYLMTGNGGWNGTTDFSESFVKLQYKPPTHSGDDGTLKVVDFFTPFVDKDRHIPDQDLGSGGAILPRPGLVAGAGKDGVLYVLNTASMGHRNNPSTAIFFTYFPGFAPNPLNVGDLDHLADAQNATHHLHGSPVAWQSAQGTMLFVWGENSPLRVWRLQPNGSVAFLAESLETASAFSGRKDAMPGGMLTLSANDANDGIIWGIVPMKSKWNGRQTEADANKEIVEGVLRAYDATNFGPNAPNGNATLKRLWQSTTPGNPQPNETRFTYNKFCPPVVADGKVFVATYDGRVLVFGL